MVAEERSEAVWRAVLVGTAIVGLATVVIGTLVMIAEIYYGRLK